MIYINICGYAWPRQPAQSFGKSEKLNSLTWAFSFEKALSFRGGCTPANGVSVDYGPVPRSAPLLPKSLIASAGITTGLMSPLSSILLSAAPRFKVLRIE